MNESQYEMPISLCVDSNGTWLYPFAKQRGDGYEYDTEQAEEHLIKIEKQLQIGDYNGSRRFLNEEECEAMKLADSNLEYEFEWELSKDFSKEVREIVPNVYLSGFEFARELMNASNFETFGMWQRVISEHGNIKHWLRDASGCKFSYFVGPGEPYLVDNFASHPKRDGGKYYFKEDKNLPALKYFAYLEGFSSYFGRITEHSKYPGNNSFITARKKFLKDNPEKGRSFDSDFIDIIKKYAWFSIHLEDAFEDLKGRNLAYEYMESVPYVIDRAYRNDEIRNGAIDVDMDSYLYQESREDFNSVDRRLSSVELSVDLEEISKQFVNILRYGKHTKEEWKEKWGDEPVPLELEKRRADVLNSYSEGIELLENYGLLEKYFTEGKLDLLKFYKPYPFWELRKNWEPRARLNLKMELRKDLMVISGLINNDELAYVEIWEGLLNRS